MNILLQKKVLRALILLLMLLPKNVQAQCACVWLDAAGVKQCVLYPNCSGGFFSACAAQPNGGNFLCDGSTPCVIYPGSTAGCAPQCMGNGACWYNGNKCVVNSICAIILPIGLIELKGKERDGHNFISWKTSFESNNAYFIVSRSQDMENWTEMVRFNGAESSTNTLSYALEDTQPEVSINYYKVTQVDFNGDAVYYGPISIDNRVEPRVLLKTVDLLGQEVVENYKGFVFNCYSDGTTEKRLN